MTIPTINYNQRRDADTPRALAEAATEAEQAQRRADAKAREARRTEEEARAAEAERFEAAVRALPDDLFDSDPEIKALRADCDVKKRQRQVALANPEVLHRAVTSLKRRIKEGGLEVAIAATEDVMAGDLTLSRAMPLQLKIEEDRRSVEVIAAALELANRGCAGLMREREDIARLALEGALRERKGQYVREHPELAASAPATQSPPSPITSRPADWGPASATANASADDDEWFERHRG